MSKKRWANKMFTLLAISVLFGVTIFFLSGKKEPIPFAPVSEAYQGIWAQVGYGNAYSVTSEGATLYQYTRETCIQTKTLSNSQVNEFMAQAILSDDGDSLSFVPESRPLLASKVTKLAVLPVVCQPGNLVVASTPTVVFEHLWHSFNDYYAFFSERHIDWHKLYAEVRPTITDDLNDDELLDVFRTLLSPLNDGHVRLLTNNDEFEFAEKSEMEQFFMGRFAEQTEFDDVQEYQNNLSEQFKELMSGYFDIESGGSVGSKVLWASNSNNVGYLYINGMEGLAGNDANSPEENVEAIDSILGNALAHLNKTDALIIDVRFNGGGYDEVSLAIANHFTDQSALAFSKTTRSFAGDTNKIDAYFRPKIESPYIGPIAILTSRFTASAAEVFLTAMSSLDHVTLVGENSAGFLADQLYRILPNKWEIAVPNVVFMDSNGTSFEVTGVPPDIEAATNLPEMLDENKDIVVEAALAALGY